MNALRKKVTTFYHIVNNFTNRAPLIISNVAVTICEVAGTCNPHCHTVSLQYVRATEWGTNYSNVSRATSFPLTCIVLENVAE